MALTAHQLMMRFGERDLFQIEQLSIAVGDAIWLRGANGVGKTTLLKILAGLLTPTRGHTNPSGWRGKLGQWLKRDPGPGRVTYLHQTPTCLIAVCTTTWPGPSAIAPPTRYGCSRRYAGSNWKAWRASTSAFCLAANASGWPWPAPGRCSPPFADGRAHRQSGCTFGCPDGRHGARSAGTGQRPGHHQPPEQRSDRPVRAAMDPRPGPAARTHSFENHRAT